MTSAALPGGECNAGRFPRVRLGDAMHRLRLSQIPNGHVPVLADGNHLRLQRNGNGRRETDW